MVEQSTTEEFITSIKQPAWVVVTRIVAFPLGLVSLATTVFAVFAFWQETSDMQVSNSINEYVGKFADWMQDHPHMFMFIFGMLMIMGGAAGFAHRGLSAIGGLILIGLGIVTAIGLQGDEGPYLLVLVWPFLFAFGGVTLIRYALDGVEP